MTEENRKLLPDVAAYFAATEKAQEEYQARRRAVHEEYEGADDLRFGSAERSTKLVDAMRDRNAAVHEARTTLAKSSDPLVAWIATNVLSTYDSEARAVLHALPATLGELDDLAYRNGWCPDWQTLRRRALVAGVVEEVPEREIGLARTALFEWASRVLGLTYPADKRRLHQLLDAVVEEEST